MSSIMSSILCEFVRKMLGNILYEQSKHWCLTVLYIYVRAGQNVLFREKVQHSHTSGIRNYCITSTSCSFTGGFSCPPGKRGCLDPRPSTTTSYSQALTVLCTVVVFIPAGVYYSSNELLCYKRETNLV